MRLRGAVGLVFAVLTTLIMGGAYSGLVVQPAADQSKRSTVLPSVRASTDCITSIVSKQPGISAHASDNSLSNSIRRIIADGSCNDAIMRMVTAYERAYGPGTGTAFFSGAYGSDLPRAVRSWLGSSTIPQDDRQASLVGSREVSPDPNPPDRCCHGQDHNYAGHRAVALIMGSRIAIS